MQPSLSVLTLRLSVEERDTIQRTRMNVIQRRKNIIRPYMSEAAERMKRSIFPRPSESICRFLSTCTYLMRTNYNTAYAVCTICGPPVIHCIKFHALLFDRIWSEEKFNFKKYIAGKLGDFLFLLVEFL